LRVKIQPVGAAVLPGRSVVIGLGLLSAVSAIGGGAELVLWPHGNPYVPIELLHDTPFETFLIPGLILAGLIGGTSLACAMLAWRRSRAAIDATIVAGSALTLWIVAEVALLRTAHWLHFVYGALGLAILGLGLLAGWRSRLPRHRWVIAVTLAEAAGFMAPGIAGFLCYRAGLGGWPMAAAVAFAGMVEGLACGAGQAWAFPLPVRRLRFALLTALGAGIVWAGVLSMLLTTEGDDGVPPLILGLAIFGTAIMGLGAIGSAQWLELRHHTPRANRWILWTALAWVVALPLSFTPGPLVDESTPIASQVALWGCAGLLMAYAMALVTWQGVRRLPSAMHGPPAPAPIQGTRPRHGALSWSNLL
jgi:hypothetical protein